MTADRSPVFASREDAVFANPASNSYPLDHLEREQWMTRQGKRPYASWTDHDDPDIGISFAIEGDPETDDRGDSRRLIYTATDRATGGERDHDHRIPLEHTDCNFGGKRPWFRCPDCDTRRGQLHLPPGREEFRCRGCYDLGYVSSRVSGNDLETAELRYRRPFEKADAEGRRPHPEADPWVPRRPPGMHHDTFDELLAVVWDVHDEWTDVLRERERQFRDCLLAVADVELDGDGDGTGFDDNEFDLDEFYEGGSRGATLTSCLGTTGNAAAGETAFESFPALDDVSGANRREISSTYADLLAAGVLMTTRWQRTSC